MGSFELTAAEKNAFDLFGFLYFPGLLTHRIGAIIEAFERIFLDHGGGHGGKPHDGRQRSCVIPFIDQSEYLSSLLEDPAVEAIFSGLLGPDFNFIGSDGNFYVGDSGWHSDGWNDEQSGQVQREFRFAKMAFYLDPLTRETGALRVIPGSHKPGTEFADQLQAQISQSKKNWNLEGRQVPAVALETKPGDVLIFNQATKHAAFGGGTARRMFTINCSQRIPQERIDIIRTYVSQFKRHWLDSVYGPKMTAGPASRMVHLEQILGNQDHLPALSAQARKEMPEPARG